MPNGAVEAVDPGPDALDGVDAVVVAASIKRPSQEGRREVFLEGNREVIDDIATWMAPCDPRPVVVVSNPVDQLTYRLWRQTEWPRERFVGYSLSETARMAAIVGDREGVEPERVSVPMLGEHGDHMVAAFSRATIDGEPYRPPADVREELLAATKQVPYDIIEHRGFEETSRWVSGRGVALLARWIVTGGSEETVCLSTPLDGAYGESDVAMSVPLWLDSDGVEGIREWELTDDERRSLSEAAASLRSTLDL
jgi:malate dehydrogenase